MKHSKHLARRTFLAGAGAALALPWLEGVAGARQVARTPRLLWIYVPNGVHMADWTPAEVGALPAELPPALAPLERHRDSLRVISGLTHATGRANGDGPGDHARAGATWLTGVQPLKEAGAVRLGVSADQVAAQRLGRATRFASLAVGVEGARNSGQCDSGYACAYSTNVSWTSPTVPAGKETDPRALFDRLCRRGWPGESDAARDARLATRGSVLDLVRADAQRLGRALGREDGTRLDSYLDSVRELERRLESSSEHLDAPFERPEADPGSYAKRLELLRDLLALALATDQTRVATFMFANEGSNRAYRQLGVKEGHHSLSHHREEADKVGAIRRINRYHTELLASVFDALKASPLGDSSVYDETIIVYGSGLADGNRHQHENLPVLVAGNGAGTLGAARHERVAKHTPMMNMHLGLLEAAGVDVARLGDSTAKLRI
ncbi:MAG: DUF1552 domain-containing protein [Planctomycetota bacterium]